MRVIVAVTCSLLFIACKTAVPSIVGKGKAIDPFHYTIKKNEKYTSGAVVSAHPLGSMVGAKILKDGGNAIDAAIATQLALAVVYPGAGNIGGGGFMVARLQNGETFTLDFRETAPAKAHRNMYIDDKGVAQTSLSQRGHLAAGIPGTVAGLFESMPYATKPFKELIQPAIDLAEYGFVITAIEADKMNENQSIFKQHNTAPTVFIKEKWKAGDTLIQKELAATLRRIRDKGRDGFYKGTTADLLVAEMKRGNGIIDHADLANYQPKKREAITFNYKGHTIITMPPPSSGGILLLQMLKMVEDRPLAKYGFHSTKAVQLVTEVERRAYADRAEYMGDPDFYKVPTATLTSDAYLKKRMADYDSTKAGKSSLTKPGVIESMETTHISIVDKWNNAVSLTTTLNGTFGSKTVVGGAGFFLNNEMDDFSIKPGVPNMYGVVGGEANAIAAGKRMLSSMTPTIVLKDNKPYIILGTPGGATIPTSVFQVITNIVDFKMQPTDAVYAPRFHHQWLPDVIQVEHDFPKNIVQQLQQMGYEVKTYGIAGYASTIGRVELIMINNGKIEAVADIRADDSVAGE
ncbi:gamma-glutamyltransferase [Aridibaculum aurantiacum]|uniref:gamma-glutamyltransferase n=1 Tax=Aridibaculum aurantiacum TaxID=2810307 RepID=UPI001A95CF37|nr:gamma-glutamyltransferase [Aridibaculum aurantiacum]